MNQGLFKLIFNRRTGMLTPTWEGAPAQGKQSTAASVCAITLTLLCFAQSVLANPSGASVVNGTVGFATNGNTLSITNSPNAIINWQSFSINKDEITRFIQQNGASAVLNRITGQDPSKILGSLQSNGRVFIINPNGIVFGKGANIDVAGLVASTLKMSDADFLSGKYNFTDGANAGAIKNEGTINSAIGGQVYLIAPDITNNGIITSPKGEIVLAAGHSVSLVDPKNPEIVVSLTAPATQAVNVGRLISEGGSIGIYAGLVNQAGTVSANSASVDESGRIFLKGTQSTTLAAGSVTSASNSAGNGGEVIVTAPEVKVEANASVDASGQTGGGTIRIGGDAHGANPDIANAKNTSVAAGAILRADALLSGNGGKVVVWADNTTHFAGHASARGGEQGGNGGFVEVSGKGLLDFAGTVDTRAAHGKQGTLLLDPLNITVGATADINGDATTGDDIASATDLDNATTDFPGANSFITASALTGLLDTTDVALAATNDINVNSALSWSANNLTLSAGRDIHVNAALGLTQSASLNLDATRDINVNAVITAADASSLMFNTGATGALRMGFNPDGTFKGRVDFSSTGPLAINGDTYTVINSLGAEGSMTTTDLQGIEGDLSGFYALGSNIDASATSGFAMGAGFSPLGSTSDGFYGAFDGLGHTINNLTINRPTTDYVGLFSYLGNVSIGNVGLVNASVVGQNYVGALAGNSDNSRINNSYATGTVSGGNNSSYIGGLAGTNSGTISNSHATGAVRGENNSSYIGGLAGTNSGMISNSYATGNVSGVASNYIGGLVGSNTGGAYGGMISDSYATGMVSGLGISQFIGGLLGENSYGTVSNSYATGAVIGEDGSSSIGGLVGYNYDTINNNSYATGNVTSGINSHEIGGLAGFNQGTISDSYASGAVTAGNAAYSISAFVGGNDYGGSISNSHSSGAVTAGDNAYDIGGLVGNLSDSYGGSTISNSYATGAVSGGASATDIGGLVGVNYYGTINDSFATGSASGGANADMIGGLVGQNLGTINTSYSIGYVAGGAGATNIGGFAGTDSGTINSSYWNTETSGLSGSAGGLGVTGRTTELMMLESSFTGFDFTQTWAIDPRTSFPYQRALFPMGVQVFSGTLDINNIPAVQQTALSSGGTGYGLSSVGANGFYYAFLDAASGITGGDQFKIDLVNGAQLATYFGDASAQNTLLDFGVGELLNASSTLSLANSTYALNIRNLGTINLDGGLTFNGLFSNSGTLNVNADTVIDKLDLVGGSIRSASQNPVNLTVSGAFNWTAGDIVGLNMLTTTGVSTLSGATEKVLDSTSWNNSGTLNLTDGFLSMFQGNGPQTFTNQVGGTVNITSTSSSPITVENGTERFVNAGTLNYNASMTSGAIDAVFENTGTVKITAGSMSTLALNRSTINEGTIDIGNTNTLSLNSSYTNMGILMGKGTIDLGQRTLTNNGSIRPGASPGTLRINGNLVLSSSSILDIELAGTSPGFFDVLNVSGNASLAGAVNALQYGGFVPSTSSSFTFLNAFAVSGTFNAATHPAAFNVALSYGANFAALTATRTLAPPGLDPSVIVDFSALPNAGSGRGANNNAGTSSNGQTVTTFNALLESAPTAAIASSVGPELYLDEPLIGEARDARLLCR